MQPIRHLRWWIVGLLFLSTTINYIDRQAMGLMAPVIREEMHLQSEEIGRVFTGFIIAYMIFQGVGGKLVDRLGTRVGLTLVMIWWSCAALLRSSARGIWQLVGLHALVGTGEGGNWPAATKAVSEWFPPRERSLAVAIFDAGSPVGGMIAAPLVASFLLPLLGWRTSFVITGLLGFLWLPLWLKLYYSPGLHPRLSAEEREVIHAGRAADPASQAEVPWLSLLGQRDIWGIVLGRMLSDPIWWFYVNWLPDYLYRTRGFSLTQMGYFNAMQFGLAAAGNLLGGFLSGRLVKRGMPVLRARKLVLLVSALTMLAVIPAAYTGQREMAAVLVGVTMMGFQSFSTMLLTLPADLYEPKVVASVSGLSGMGAGLGGVIFNEWVRRVLDRISYLPVLVTAGIVPLFAAFLVFAFIRQRPAARAREAHP